MGLFNNLMSKIFGHATSATATAPGAQTQSATAPEQQAQAQARRPRQLQPLLHRRWWMSPPF